MRINLPSAILLSGTVLLLSAAGVIAKTSDAATPETSGATVTTQPAGDTVSTTTTEAASKTETATTPNGTAPGAPSAAGANIKVPGTSAAARGAMFKFGAESEKDAIVDAPEAIEKARGLHAKAMEQAKNKDYPAAMATEKEAIAAAEHYWLPHAGMVYLMMNSDKKKAMEALKEASLSLYGKHGAVAERNSAKLFQAIHWNPPAQKALEAAIKMEPDNWKALLALADLQTSVGNMSSAIATLELIKPELLSSYEVADPVASRYIVAEKFDKAKEILAKALTIAPTEIDKKDVIDRQFICALKSGDIELLKSTVGQVSDTLKNSRPDMYIQAKSLLAQTPADADAILEQSANLHMNSEKGQIFFAAGREFVKKATASEGDARKEWLRKAAQAYKNAISRNAADLSYRIALASVFDQLADSAGVAQVLAELKESIAPGSETLKLTGLEAAETNKKIADFNKYNFVKSFEAKDTAPGATLAYRSNARELKYRILKSSCSCHARSMKKALTQEPGVIFVDASKEDRPVISVIYDGRLNNQKKLMAAKIIETLKDPIELVSDTPVETFAQLTAVMVEPEQKTVIAVKRDNVMEVPMDNAGQVAQNSEPPVR